MAIVVPPLAAFTPSIVGNPGAATFAVFGSFALLGWRTSAVRRCRGRAYALTTVAGVGLVLLGTLASANAWSAVVGTVLVAFVIQLLGDFGGYVVAAQTAALLAFVVAVSIPVPAGMAWLRVAGWLLGGGVSLAAGVLLWPRHARTQVRQRAGDACRALAALLGDPEMPEAARDQARARVEDTRRAYDQAPLRPAGPGRRDRALIDLVLQLDRMAEFAGRTALAIRRRAVLPEERTLRRTISKLLEATAGVLAGEAADPDLAALDRDRVVYRQALDRWAAERLRAGGPRRCSTA